MTDRELLESIASEIKLTKDELKEKMAIIESRLSEHTEILQAVRHAQEVQKAQIDQLQLAVAHIEGWEQRISTDITYLVRKSAQYTEDIQELRQAK